MADDARQIAPPAFFHSVEKNLSRGGGIFHSVEKFPKVVPLRGKVAPKLFHCVEKFLRVFPLRGKIGASFSTVWKNLGSFFHSVESPARAG